MTKLPMNVSKMRNIWKIEIQKKMSANTQSQNSIFMAEARQATAAVIDIERNLWIKYRDLIKKITPTILNWKKLIWNSTSTVYRNWIHEIRALFCELVRPIHVCVVNSLNYENCSHPHALLDCFSLSRSPRSYQHEWMSYERASEKNMKDSVVYVGFRVLGEVMNGHFASAHSRHFHDFHTVSNDGLMDG